MDIQRSNVVEDQGDITPSFAIDGPILEAVSNVNNGSFETGDFESWNTIGDTSIETDSLGVFPTDGASQALINTGVSDAGGSVADSDLEEFLDLSPGSLDNLIDGDAFDGSAIKQTVELEAGDVVSFDWNFLTNEGVPSDTFNDTAFLSGGGFTFELASTESDFVDAPDVDEYSQQTGSQTLTFSVGTAGTFNFGFGAVDVGDDIVDSGLVIDNLTVQSASSGAAESFNAPDLILGEDGFSSTVAPEANSQSGGLVLGENGFV